MKRSLSGSRKRYAGHGILVFLAAVLVVAQEPNFSTIRSMMPASVDIEPAAVAKYSLTGASQEQRTSQIDNSIDETSYYIGGGDVFQISLSDLTGMTYYGTVNQNADLFVKSLGIIPLGKCSLSSAKQKIANYIQKKLKKQNEVYIALIQTKSATITISGSATTQGTSTLSGTSRIWDALRSASREPNVLSAMHDNDLRQVVCRNRDSTKIYDLLAFLFKGDLSQNPYVYPGDQIILVPASRGVSVFGAIKGKITGWIPIRPGETVASMLSLFTLDDAVDSTSVFIQRTGQAGASSTIIVNLKKNPDFELQNYDLITVVSKLDQSETFVVNVSGEIAKPGFYPIKRGGTTAREIVEQAGNYLPFANTDKASVLRLNKPFSAKISKPTETNEQTLNVRPEIISGLKMMALTRDYSIIKIKDHPETILEPWDHIFVPRAERLVYVSGSVRRPGAYPFMPGKKKGYYIDCAGGCTETADKQNIYTISFFDDNAQMCSGNEILDGDVVVVPTSQQYRKMSVVVLPLVNATVSTLALILGIFATVRR